MLSKLPCCTICVQTKILTQVFLDSKALILTIITLLSPEVWISFSGSNFEAQTVWPWWDTENGSVCVCVCVSVGSQAGRPQVSGAREAEWGGQRQWDMIIQESRVFCDSCVSLPPWVRRRRKWKRVSMTLESASLERTSRTGCWKQRVKRVKSWSLQESGTTSFSYLVALPQKYYLPLPLIFLCGTEVSHSLEPAPWYKTLPHWEWKEKAGRTLCFLHLGRVSSQEGRPQAKQRMCAPIPHVMYLHPLPNFV